MRFKLSVVNAKSDNNKFSLLSLNENFTDIEFSSMVRSRRNYISVFFTDPKGIIKPNDWVLVSNNHDGDIYPEKCKLIAIEGKDYVFYGEEGTRCMLIDTELIVASTAEMVMDDVADIKDDFLIEYANLKGQISEVLALINDSKMPKEITILKNNNKELLEKEINSEYPF